MGGGTYNYSDRASRAASSGYVNPSLSNNQVFKQRSIHPDMDPKGLVVRESRDSDEHPNSFPIIIGLDVTGSMGNIPRHFISEGLPNLIKRLIDSGIADPQVLFLGIGDHTVDRAPLQVGQFESSDELMDHWLENIYLEGGGGGNWGESYLLAWLIAGFYTSTDHFDKRGKKGILVTIGDENCLKDLTDENIENLMGSNPLGTDISAEELYIAASTKFNCFHVNLGSSISGDYISENQINLGRNELSGIIDFIVDKSLIIYNNQN